MADLLLCYYVGGLDGEKWNLLGEWRDPRNISGRVLGLVLPCGVDSRVIL